MDIVFEAPQNAFRQFTDIGGGRHAERVEAYPPTKLMTDGDGEYSRIRVDVGQTGFFAGREARTFYEFSIPTGTSKVIKVISPTDTILQSFSVETFLAEIRTELVIGGTEGGSFSAALPIFKTNTMADSSDYAPQVTMNVGGTHSGGTVVDLLVSISGPNKNKALSSSATEDSPQGFAAGTFYIRLINTDGATATGIFRARWEERP